MEGVISPTNITKWNQITLKDQKTGAGDEKNRHTESLILEIRTEAVNSFALNTKAEFKASQRNQKAWTHLKQNQTCTGT